MTHYGIAIVWVSSAERVLGSLLHNPSEAAASKRGCPYVWRLCNTPSGGCGYSVRAAERATTPHSSGTASYLQQTRAKESRREACLRPVHREFPRRGGGRDQRSVASKVRTDTPTLPQRAFQPQPRGLHEHVRVAPLHNVVHTASHNRGPGRVRVDVKAVVRDSIQDPISHIAGVHNQLEL